MVRGRSAFNDMNSTYKRNRDIRFSLQRSEMFIGSSAHAKLSLAIALLRNVGVKIRIVNYLSKLNVGIDDVRQAQFSSLGVRGTPTLILVDNNGAAVKSWVGRLPPNGEAEVISALQ